VVIPSKAERRDSDEEAAVSTRDRRQGRTLSRFNDVLPRLEFARQIEIEKRRTDRSKSPLSLVIFHVEGSGEKLRKSVDRLLTTMQYNKRETDVLGYLGGNRVALLLPDTGASGAEGFVRSIESRTGERPNVVERGTYPAEVFDNLLAGRPAITEESTFSSHEAGKRGPWSRTIKRGLDIVGALVSITVASPVMLLAALAVKVSSPGPVIFKQTRLGRRGVPFTFYKFRSMVVNNDDRVHREYVQNLIQGRHDAVNQGDNDQPLYKIQADPRVTPIGRFIRKSSIDELPQLFNVLKGDMSLVGPRPPIPYETERYESWHLRRILDVNPGITGLWQVEGRNRVTFDDMVRLDLCYARDWSIWLDMKILVKTVVAVLRFDGEA
jgi:lipopolysaccharide/colanic/teichoic acid biosynthesis glycosyltransferase